MATGWEWAAVAPVINELLESDAAKALKAKVVDTGSSIVNEQWTRFKWGRAEESYRSRLLPLVSTTRLLGNPKPVNIDQLYTDLFVYDKVSALRRTVSLTDPRLDKQKQVADPSDRISAIDVVGTGRNLYLLGHPGAGKTTFMRYLAILACKGILGQVPIYLQLRDVARSYVPLAAEAAPSEVQRRLKQLVFISLLNEFEVCAFPETERFVNTLLKRGRALVLLDGLDEVPDTAGMRAAVIDSIRDLQRRFPSTQICVTCRIAASEYAFEHFDYAEVAGFTELQQQAFIRKWYVDDLDKRRRLLKSWSEERSRPLRDLAKKPLLLALICLAFDDLDELPDRYVDLYREALEALLKRWDGSRSIVRDPFYGGLTPYRREQLLQEIAADLFKTNIITFSAGDVQRLIERWFKRLPDAPKLGTAPLPIAELLEQIEAQHGLIVQRSRYNYSFSHLSIQEFLCARSIVEGHPDRSLESLCAAHIGDSRWREVIVFCAGLLQDGTAFLRALVKGANQIVNRQGSLPAFLSQVAGSFAGGKVAETNDFDALSTSATGARSPLLLAASLVRRLDELSWAGRTSALRMKAALACDFLVAAKASSEHVFHSLAAEGSELGGYLAAVSLIVDCAAVATCEERATVIAPLLAPFRS